MHKLFFKYLDAFIVFWMDDMLIYSQTEEEHLKHIQLVFKNSMKHLKGPNAYFSKVK